MMAISGLLPRARQVSALVHCFFHLLWRHSLATLIQAFLLPILILVLCLESKNLGVTNYPFHGIGPSAPIKTLSNVLQDGTSLVLVVPPSLGPDVTIVAQKITDSLQGAKGQVRRLTKVEDLPTQCVVDYRGQSGCHAAIVFDDSPETEGKARKWNYTIRTDPYQARDSPTDIWQHNSFVDNYFLPVQFAVDQAITGTTETPSTYVYTSLTAKEAEESQSLSYSKALIYSTNILFFVPFLFPIAHIVTTISRRRSQGLATLIDLMGGGAPARVWSDTIVFNVLYLPLWIISGSLIWHYLLPDSNAAIIIIWNLLFGIATVNTAIFGASFVKKSALAGILVAGSMIVLGYIASITVVQPVDDFELGTIPQTMPPTAMVVVLSVLFPSMSFIYSLCSMARYQALGWGVNLVSLPGEIKQGDVQAYKLVPLFFGLFFLISIVLNFVLAIVVEKRLHGINEWHRSLGISSPAGSTYETAVLEVSSLTKVYPRPWYKAMFCRGTKVEALSNVSFKAYRNQILCLLGVNGSGKTTTLDLIAGFQRPTSGDVKLNVGPHQLGICTQRNILFNRLTVLEHVKFWCKLKGSEGNDEMYRELVRGCGLADKVNTQARYLSGGQKRKLQLACMFSGNPTLCVMDEVTTGLDPVSRRGIWNIIRAERAKRSMIFTTHFLDDAEILADRIVMLTQGRTTCQGSATELKNQYGNGYTVEVSSSPLETGRPIDIDQDATLHRDRLSYHAPDSHSAAELVSRLEGAGHKDVTIAGPTIEDVFLNLNPEERGDNTELEGMTSHSGMDGKVTSLVQNGEPTFQGSHTPAPFWRLVMALFWKRRTVLLRYWIAPLICVVLPLALTGALTQQIQNGGGTYGRLDCEATLTRLTEPPADQVALWDSAQCLFPPCEWFGLLVAPDTRDVRDNVTKVLRNFTIGAAIASNSTLSLVNYSSTLTSFSTDVATNHGGLEFFALYMGDNSTPPTIAFRGDYVSQQSPMEGLNMWSQASSGVEIVTRSQAFASMSSTDPTADANWIIIILCLPLAIYPAFFALYPAYEKNHHIRALQFANGVRPSSLWTAHLLFDLIFVLIISVGVTGILASQYHAMWLGVGAMFPVLVLYGLAATLKSYAVSLFFKTQLAVFVTALLAGLLEMALSFVAILEVQSNVDQTVRQSATDGVTFGLGLLFPMMNVIKSMLFGLNSQRVGCRDNITISNGASIYGYGGPILLLFVQIAALLSLLVLLDSGLAFPKFSSMRNKNSVIEPEHNVLIEEEVSKEATRVSHTDTDLLAVSHVSKSFGPLTAVDDISLGLGEGEVVALLGPNGAGKSTLVNMIRGDLNPDTGTITIKDINIHKATRSAQRHLGVCPQFDALDLLTARQHLAFYARIKGVPDINAAVTTILAMVSLTPHASKPASKLSGGNKRKLSLGIALMGNPQVLILDEPSSSMDARAKRIMWRTLAQISQGGRAIMLTTHSMEEADALATRVAIMSKRLLAVGTTDQLRRRFSDLYSVQIVLKSAPDSADEEVDGVERWLLGNCEGARIEEKSLGGQIKFIVPNSTGTRTAAAADGDGGADGGGGGIGDRDRNEGYTPTPNPGHQSRNTIAQLIQLLEQHKETLGIREYSIGAPTLESVFLSVVKDEQGFEPDERRKRWWSIL